MDYAQAYVLNIFEMDDDGKAIASKNEVPQDLMHSAREGAEQCPVTCNYSRIR